MDAEKLISKAKTIFPQSITILPTYRCNAECNECCFESNPRIKHRLSLSEIKAAINQAHATFPALQLIVFSGGEVFLLKDDLYEAISHARSKGLLVRCVTNGFWGKSEKQAKDAVRKLISADVSEINISTGSDHQAYVPLSSIENACTELVAAKILTLLTVEKDSEKTKCLAQIRNSPRIRPLITESAGLFSIQCNSWMPFHENYTERGAPPGLESLTGGCTQVFNNFVVTPYNRLSACCGLTFEHIPEMTLGDLAENSMNELFGRSIGDFLKIWVHLDGPATIMRKLFGDEINDELKEVRHICQACAVLHLHPKVRKEVLSRYTEFLPEVMARFSLKTEIRSREQADTVEMFRTYQSIRSEGAV